MNLPKVTHTHTRRSASSATPRTIASIGHMDMDRWNIEAALFVVCSLNCYSHPKKKTTITSNRFVPWGSNLTHTDSSVQIACPKIMQLSMMTCGCQTWAPYHGHLQPPDLEVPHAWKVAEVTPCMAVNGPFPKNLFLFGCDTLGAQ